MNSQSPFDRRVAALIAAYADRAPIEVDPIAMTRLAAAGSRRIGPVRMRFAPAGLGLWFALLLLALLVAIVGGSVLAGGASFQRDLRKIAPFVGLPPVGAPPTSPETGELVLSFYGRVRSIGLEFHRVWVYADGRLIWKRNLDGMTDTGRLAFGATEPTVAVIEQNLTPEGVELMRAEAISAGLSDAVPVNIGPGGTRWGRPGVLWGGLSVQQGEGPVEVDWSDPDLPGRLADPASWLPASAWEDQRIGGYVPSRYAVCVSTGNEAASSRAMALLPEAVRDVISSRAIEAGALERGRPFPGCPYQVTTEDARLLAATFEAGLQQDPHDNTLRYYIPGRDDWVELLPILPDGGVVCNCG